ncbi:MAG: argininosuccinate lyase [Ectobacillus sp.]
MSEAQDSFVKKEGEAFPGKTYAEHLLKHVFAYQRDYLYKEMFAIHYAHAVMLIECGILQKEEGKQILRGIREVEQHDFSVQEYDSRYEDLFFLVEDRIQEAIGSEKAGNMHIARSRNDMGVAMYRMVLRRHLLQLLDCSIMLGESLLEKAAEQKTTIVTAYTHTQPAQPTALGHYFLAIFDGLGRDIKRLFQAYETVNRSPLGAAALATTGFPINRERVAQLLGFSGLVENSYDAIAGADYLLEASAAVAMLMTNAGRWIQDFLVQATKEFGGIVVADPYVQTSSIMPQKRNPVSIEHSRALASSSYAEALSVFHMIHNTPFGDIVDTEDDLQPHLYRSCEKAKRVMHLMNAVIRTMHIDKEKLEEKAKQHAITITELADVLTRDKGVSFRQAHKLASAIAKECNAKKIELHELKPEEASKLLSIQITEKEWHEITSPQVFVQRRCVQGGPCEQEMDRMIEDRQRHLQKLQEKAKQYTDKLKEADVLLQKVTEQYIKQ